MSCSVTAPCSAARIAASKLAVCHAYTCTAVILQSIVRGLSQFSPFGWNRTVTASCLSGFRRCLLCGARDKSVCLLPIPQYAHTLDGQRELHTLYAGVTQLGALSETGLFLCMSLPCSQDQLTPIYALCRHGYDKIKRSSTARRRILCNDSFTFPSVRAWPLSRTRCNKEYPANFSLFYGSCHFGSNHFKLTGKKSECIHEARQSSCGTIYLYVYLQYDSCTIRQPSVAPWSQINNICLSSPAYAVRQDTRAPA